MEVVRGSHVDTHQWLMPSHAWPTRLKMILFYKPKSEAYCLPALIHTPALAIITTTLTASAHLWTPPPPWAAAPAGRKPMAELPTAGLLLLRPASYCCWCDPAGYCCCTRLGGPSTFPLPYGHHHPCCCYPSTCPHQHIPPLLHRLRGLPWRTGLAAAWLVLVLRPKGLLVRCTRLAGPPVSLSNTFGEGLGLRPNLLGL